MTCPCIADAAYSLIQKKGQLFALNSNNALLQFVLSVSAAFGVYTSYIGFTYTSENMLWPLKIGILDTVDSRTRNSL